MSRNLGSKRLRAELRAAPAEIRRAVGRSIKATVAEAHAEGLANIDRLLARRSGRTRRYYQAKVARDGLSGDVGYIARAARKAFYAAFQHFGTSKLRARPFHSAAVRTVLPKHQRRMLTAAEAAFDPAGRRRK